MSLHLELGPTVETVFGDVLDSPVEQKQDALIIRLKNGVTLSVRYAAPDAYSLRWAYGDAESGIDTAPRHPDLATFPNHMHPSDGEVTVDPVTRPDADPETNLHALIRALIDNPMFGIAPIA